MIERGTRRRAGGLATVGAVVVVVISSGPAEGQDKDDAQPLESIQVRETPFMAPGPGERFAVDPEDTTTSGVDAADLVGRSPGYSVNDNGPISGQVQHRGMFGPRTNVSIDGMYMNPGGPNWMDPPLHYAPPGLIEDIEAERGIAPVSNGISAIGGAVNATFKSSRFAPTQAFETSIEANAQGRTGLRSGGGAGFAEVANNRHRAHAMISGSKGGDIAFPGGEIKATEHERIMGGGGYGVKLAPGHELAFNVRQHNTEDSGNPSLPLDIRFFDTTILKSKYTGDYRFGNLNAELYYSDIDHQMDNVTLRSPGTGNPRRVNASSSGLGWSLSLARGLSLGTLTVGFDGHLAGHEMNILNPRNPAFFVDNFEDIDRDRFSAFGEWNARVTQRLSLDLGLRVTRVEMRAGRVGPGQAPGAPPVQRLATGFNQGDRDVSDTNVDVVAKLAYDVSDRLTLRLEGGRKTRSPSYIERFAWLPVETTAGLADGNNHIGQVGLAPEVAHEVGVGFDWTTADSYFRPRVFYRDVDDFITGTPLDATPNTIDSDVERVSNVNGDATPLIYSNTGAEFYGFDVDFGYRFTDRWRLDGQVSLTRAERTDIDDNVYRVPPANGRLRLTHARDRWDAFFETELLADEDRISETNFDPAQTEDPRTDGHALLNIGGSWRMTSSATVRLAVNNLLDDRYNDPLGGFNRVANSDVAVGDRIPGAGRSFFVALNARF